MPTIDTFKTADDPPNTQIDISGEWSKRLTSRFGVSFDGAWTDLKTATGDVSGFQNFGTTLKYLALHQRAPTGQADGPGRAGREWAAQAMSVLLPTARRR